MDFDGVLNLEEQFFQEGFEEGQAESTKKSYLEGREYGIQTGFQKFLIIGHIQSFISLIRDQGIFEDQVVSGQVTQHLEQLSGLLQDLKFDNEYGNVINNEKLMVKIRNKVRILSNMLPSRKVLNLQSFDQLLQRISGLETVPEPSVANLNDDGMW